MISLVRIIVLASVAFLVPVFFALWLKPLLLSENEAESTISAPPEMITDEIVRNSQQGDDTTPAGFVPSDPFLDPNKGENFVLSFELRFESLPQAGPRQQVVSKYVLDRSPYPGWAFAFQRLATSLRPMIYWRGPRDGKGNYWLTFEEFSLVPGRRYSFTLLARGGDYVSLYAQMMPEPESSSTAELDSKVHYLGGFRTRTRTLPRTTADLRFGKNKARQNGFAGNISYLLIAHPETLPNAINEGKDFVKGGPLEIEKRVAAAAVALRLDEAYRDTSPFKREVRFSSNSSS